MGGSPGEPRRAWLPIEEARVPRAIVGLGIAFFLSVPAQWIAFVGLRPGPFLSVGFLVSLLTAGVPALGIAYGGYRIERSDLPPDRYPRIAGWCVGGSALFLGLNLVVIAAFPAESLRMNVGWAIGTAIYGGVAGLLVGSVEARAIERARAAERAEVEAERAAAEREWFDYLNTLLRHEVLNTANVIEGQAALLAERYEDEELQERLGSIRRHSRNMTRVIDDVRALIRATEDVESFDRVCLADVLASEVRALRDTYDHIEVETSLSDATVLADDLLARAFSNLLDNAIEHNDAEVPRVQVTVETDGEWAVVEIADNGPGISPAEREDLFERTHDGGRSHGFGLYLVDTVLERYGGSVELVDTGPEGSTFRVRLPLASASADEVGGSVDPIRADA